jgi:hypothetical protein
MRASDTLFRGLLDDASLFPPAELPMPDAVTGHLRHESAWYHDMSGPFVCAAARIDALTIALTAATVAELDLALVAAAGGAGLLDVVDAISAEPRLRLRAVEVPVALQPDQQADEDQVTLAVSNLVDVLDGVPLAGATAFVEVPLVAWSDRALRVIADHGYLAKLRTGGVTAAAFPDEQLLGRCLSALAEHRMAFKCTAGLHHAVRHTAQDTGFEQHGFLNVLLGTAAALSGADAADVAAMLADRDAVRLAGQASSVDADAAAEIRGLFRSFGTCSTDEPLTDLVTLGLVSDYQDDRRGA